MQPFQIFKAGKHVSAAGTAIAFSDADLKKAVEAYDPAVHEAPIVVGHPKNNGPAYGWVKSLSFSDGAIVAEPQQVDESFAEMVQAGRFKKRSASFYTPDSQNNPKPGAFYLRHVGFLGAQPPAVKGLKDVNFADDDAVTVEFSDGWFMTAMAGAMRRLREFLIAEHGIDDADKALPDYLVSELEAEARKPVEVASAASANPSFTEPTMTPTAEQLAAEKARADKAEAEAKAACEAAAKQAADFAEREKALAAREVVVVRQAVEARVDGLIKDGKVLPAQKKATVDFAMSLQAGEATFDFGEGDNAKKVTQRDLYLEQLAVGPKLVEYGEASPAAKKKDAEEIAAVEKRLRDQVASGGKADADKM